MDTAAALVDALLGPEGNADPYPILAELRALGPVVPYHPTGGLMTTTFAAARDVSRSDDAATMDHLVSLYVDPDEPLPEGAEALFDMTSHSVLFNDPPDHTRLRALLQKAFTARLVAQMEPRLRDLLDELLADLASRDEPDLVQHLADHYPTSVIATVLGIPPEQRAAFKPIAQRFTRLLGQPITMELIAEVIPDFREFEQFVNAHIAAKRAAPDDGLLSAMIAAEEESDQLSNAEIVANTLTMLIAGHESTTNLLGGGMWALLTHRDQWDQLVADPSLAGPATEELLRWDPPLQQTGRRAVRDMVVAGVEIQAGTPITVSYAAAGRDPSVYKDPDTLDITRNPTDQLAFGLGRHYCIGAVLARLEGRLAFAALASRFPDVVIDTERPVIRPPGRVLRGLDSLPVRLGA